MELHGDRVLQAMSRGATRTFAATSGWSWQPRAVATHAGNAVARRRQRDRSTRLGVRRIKTRWRCGGALVDSKPPRSKRGVEIATMRAARGY
jgi:hypothetical protein